MASNKNYQSIGHTWRTLVMIAAVAATCPAASFSGTFVQDNELDIRTFSILTDSNIVIRTFGYGGGMNGAGESISAGGFDPFLSVFAGTGPTATLIGVNDDGSCPPLSADPHTGSCLDAYLNFQNLAAGTYTVVLSQYGNAPVLDTLGDGFTFDSQPNYTSTEVTGLPGSFWASPPPDQRNGAWAYDINIPDATVPEPGYAPGLLVAGLLGWFGRRKRNA